MPALEKLNENVATSMKAKEAFVYQSAFPKPFTSFIIELVIIFGVAYKEITEEKVYFALVTQVIAKAPKPNKISFRILHIIWNWEKERMTSMV